ncbi:MAG: hypothetical protein OEL75_00655 [Kiritimatiellaceae bacterium]|nr:hypothetical protein [Kiritimatiellaceae bacterium]
MGTCRGSTPILNPAKEPKADQKTITCAGITFFLNPEIADDFQSCSMECDRSFFGKGLTATWPHREGCACHS